MSPIRSSVVTSRAAHAVLLFSFVGLLIISSTQGNSSQYDAYSLASNAVFEVISNAVTALDIKFPALAQTTGIERAPATTCACQTYFTFVSSAQGRGYFVVPGLGIPIIIAEFYEEEMVELISNKFHTISISRNGKVFINGFYGQSHGQFGLRSRASHVTPVPIPAFNNEVVIAADAGLEHTVIAVEDGRVFGFGRNDDLQAGVSDTSDQIEPQLITSLSGVRVRKVACGGKHSVVLDADGGVWVWGRNAENQLGLPLAGTSAQMPTKVDLPAGRRAIAVSAGDYFTVIVLDDHSVLCAGDASSGQCGGAGGPSATTLASFTEIPTDHLGSDTPKIIGAAARYDRVVFFTSDKRVFVLGNNAQGRLGAGSDAQVSQLREVSIPGARVVRACLGEAHVGFIDDEGNMYTAGSNSNWQLVTSKSEVPDFRTAPGRVTAFDGVQLTDVSVGLDHAVVQLGATKRVMISGRNLYGQGMQGELSAPAMSLRSAVGVSDVGSSCAGHSYTLTCTPAGELFGSGRHDRGQLGFTPSNAFVAEKSSQFGGSGQPACASVFCGPSASAVVDTDGVVWFAGDNRHGQLGTGSVSDAVTAFTALLRSAVGGANVSQVCLGANHTTLITSTGATYAMGTDANGALGQGASSPVAGFSSTPLLVQGSLASEQAVECAAGTDFSLVRTAANEVHHFGALINLTTTAVSPSGDIIEAACATVEDELLSHASDAAAAVERTRKCAGSAWRPVGRSRASDTDAQDRPSARFLYKSAAELVEAMEDAFVEVGGATSTNGEIAQKFLHISGVTAIDEKYKNRKAYRKRQQRQELVARLWNNGKSHESPAAGSNAEPAAQRSGLRSAPVSAPRVRADAAAAERPIRSGGAAARTDAGAFATSTEPVATASSNVPTKLSFQSLGGGVVQISAGGLAAGFLRSDGAVLTWGYSSTGALGQGDAVVLAEPTVVSLPNATLPYMITRAVVTERVSVMLTNVSGVHFSMGQNAFGAPGVMMCRGGASSQFIENEMRCLPCNPGSADKSADSRCTLCEPGTYQDAASAKFCFTVPAGSVTRQHGATAYETCPSGFMANTNRTACAKCPTGADCSSGGSDARALRTRAGFSSSADGQIYTCSNAAHCPGSANTDSPTGCAPGRQGVVCAECREGLTQIGASCVLCDPGGEDGWIIFAFLGVAFLGYFLVFRYVDIGMPISPIKIRRAVQEMPWQDRVVRVSLLVSFVMIQPQIESLNVELPPLMDAIVTYVLRNLVILVSPAMLSCALGLDFGVVGQALFLAVLSVVAYLSILFFAHVKLWTLTPQYDRLLKKLGLNGYAMLSSSEQDVWDCRAYTAERGELWREAQARKDAARAGGAQVAAESPPPGEDTARGAKVRSVVCNPLAALRRRKERKNALRQEKDIEGIGQKLARPFMQNITSEVASHDRLVGLLNRASARAHRRRSYNANVVVQSILVFFILFYSWFTSMTNMFDCYEVVGEYHMRQEFRRPCYTSEWAISAFYVSVLMLALMCASVWIISVFAKYARGTQFTSRRIAARRRYVTSNAMSLEAAEAAVFYTMLSPAERILMSFTRVATWCHGEKARRAICDAGGEHPGGVYALRPLAHPDVDGELLVLTPAREAHDDPTRDTEVMPWRALRSVTGVGSSGSSLRLVEADWLDARSAGSSSPTADSVQRAGAAELPRESETSRDSTRASGASRNSQAPLLSDQAARSDRAAVERLGYGVETSAEPVESQHDSILLDDGRVQPQGPMGARTSLLDRRGSFGDGGERGGAGPRAAIERASRSDATREKREASASGGASPEASAAHDDFADRMLLTKHVPGKFSGSFYRDASNKTYVMRAPSGESVYVPSDPNVAMQEMGRVYPSLAKLGLSALSVSAVAECAQRVNADGGDDDFLYVSDHYASASEIPLPTFWQDVGCVAKAFFCSLFCFWRWPALAKSMLTTFRNAMATAWRLLRDPGPGPSADNVMCGVEMGLLVLWYRFKDPFWAWEIFRISYRILLQFILVLIPRAQYQLVIGIVFACGTAMYHLRAMPYRDYSYSIAEGLMYVTIALQLSLAFVVRAESGVVSDAQLNDVLQVTIVILFIGIFACTLFDAKALVMLLAKLVMLPFSALVFLVRMFSKCTNKTKVSDNTEERSIADEVENANERVERVYGTMSAEELCFNVASHAGTSESVLGLEREQPLLAVSMMYYCPKCSTAAYFRERTPLVYKTDVREAIDEARRLCPFCGRKVLAGTPNSGKVGSSESYEVCVKRLVATASVRPGATEPSRENNESRIAEFTPPRSLRSSAVLDPAIAKALGVNDERRCLRLDVEKFLQEASPSETGYGAYTQHIRCHCPSCSGVLEGDLDDEPSPPRALRPGDADHALAPSPSPSKNGARPVGAESPTGAHAARAPTSGQGTPSPLQSSAKPTRRTFVQDKRVGTRKQAAKARGASGASVGRAAIVAQRVHGSDDQAASPSNARRRSSERQSRHRSVSPHAARNTGANAPGGAVSSRRKPGARPKSRERATVTKAHR